ncbi:sporulation delaying protein family toxin [Bacillus cereus]|uniref:sporulation delaying protein family toxin n=1 Tax=Bacillus cereus TaxID=1396 RepID=UPI0018799D75|nr:sporulation delaying protein family toxin [Bacillus cereus]
MNYMINHKKPLLSIALVMALLVSMISIPLTRANAETSVKFTGEEIYAGIFFGQGEIAELLPEIWDKKALETIDPKELEKLSNETIEKLKQEKPNYFKELQAAVYAKDYKGVDDILKESATVLTDVLKSDVSKDKGTAAAIGKCASAVWLLLNAAVAVEVIAIGVAVLVRNVNNDTLDNGLSNEQLISDIVNRIN